MKQLYFTSCKAGRSVNGESGFQVRAATASLSPDQQTRVAALARYALPAGYADDIPAEKAPRRLALIEVAGLGRVLFHCAHVGRDPDTNRFGNFFAHAIIAPTTELNPLLALRTWGAAFWKTRDEDGPPAIPEDLVKTLTFGTEMAEAKLAEFVGRYRREVDFLLHGLLTLDSQRRLFLVADPRVMAHALYCVMNILPNKVLADLTFSTYEPEPLSSHSRLVATCWAPGSTMDLDSQCYDGIGYGYNPQSDRRSPQNAASAGVRGVRSRSTSERWRRDD